MPSEKDTRPVAVINGAAQGVGYLVAKELAATHRVALVDVQEDEVRRAATESGSDALADERLQGQPGRWLRRRQ